MFWPKDCHILSLFCWFSDKIWCLASKNGRIRLILDAPSSHLTEAFKPEDICSMVVEWLVMLKHICSLVIPKGCGNCSPPQYLLLQREGGWKVEEENINVHSQAMSTIGVLNGPESIIIHQRIPGMERLYLIVDPKVWSKRLFKICHYKLRHGIFTLQRHSKSLSLWPLMICWLN